MAAERCVIRHLIRKEYILKWETEQLLSYSRKKKRVLKSEESEEKEAVVHILTPDFQFVLAADTATPSSLAQWGNANLQRAPQAQPRTCLWCKCGQTDLPLRPSEGVLLFEQAVLLACWKRSPFSSAPSSQGLEWPPASQRSLLLPWQHDLRIPPINLRASWQHLYEMPYSALLRISVYFKFILF